jgi:hypothetical protein
MQEQLRQLKVLFDQLELHEHGIKKSVSGGNALSSDFEHDAEDSLQAAEDEFELIDYAGALTSAKRAISCQIDEVLECLGYPWKRKQLREKLDLIARCGFAAPRILKRVNDARNLLEHEYVHPTPETTEEALDIATLFVNATRRHFQMFMGEFYVGNGAERIDQFHFRRELSFTFNDNTPEFRVSGYVDVSPEDAPTTHSSVGHVSVSASSSVFPTLIKLTVAGDHDHKVAVAFHELFTMFREAV